MLRMQKNRPQLALIGRFFCKRQSAYSSIYEAFMVPGLASRIPMADLALKLQDPATFHNLRTIRTGRCDRLNIESCGFTSTRKIEYGRAVVLGKNEKNKGSILEMLHSDELGI